MENYTILLCITIVILLIVLYFSEDKVQDVNEGAFYILLKKKILQNKF